MRASRGCNLDRTRVLSICLTRKTVAERFHARNFAGWAAVWKLNPNRSINGRLPATDHAGFALLARDGLRGVCAQNTEHPESQLLLKFSDVTRETHVARVAGCVGECRGSRWSDLIFALC